MRLPIEVNVAEVETRRQKQKKNDNIETKCIIGIFQLMGGS